MATTATPAPAAAASSTATANGDQMLEFDHIFQEIRGMMYPGKLRLRQADIFFKNEKTGRIDHYSSSDIEQVQWIIRARGFCLKFLLGDLIYRYDGFREADFDKLYAFARGNWQVEIEKKDLAYKGWNWGQLNFTKNALELEVAGHTAFELPLNNVANVSTGKQEVTLEFHQNDDAEVCLMEMRFHIGERSELQCEEVAKRVMDKADIIQLTGDALCEFKELYCVQPRGRYDFRFYPTFLHMHGKTFDYKIPISTIYRMFVLPHADGRQNFLVLGLEPPIKHGQTRYHFLILLFDVEIETTVELRCSDDELQNKYGGKLQKEMSGKEFEVISRLCRVLVNRKITVPGHFRSKSGGHYISCGYKANTGFLYPLDRGFIFVPKPPMHVRFEEISSVQFSRGTASVRSFDFEINTKAGVNYTFNSVEKDEYSHLYKFVQDKQLPVKNIGEEDTTGKLEAWESSEAESDGDDVYMKRVKAEGKERTAGTGANTSGGGGGGGGESDDDSEDEDFLPPEASGSEVEEEYDTDADPSEFSSDTDYSDEEARKRKKRRLAKTVPEEGFGDYTEKKKEKARRKEAAKSGAGKAKVSRKDRNAPKRPASAYFLFLEDERPKIKADQPDLRVTEIGRVAGERWAKLDEARKKGYQERAEELKVKYQADLAEYQAKLERGEVKPDIQEKRKSAAGGDKAGGAAAATSSSAAGSGANYKSAEFINDSDVSSVSSSSADDEGEEEAEGAEQEDEEEQKNRQKKKQQQHKKTAEKPEKKKEKPAAAKGKKKNDDDESSIAEEDDEEEASGSGSGTDSD